MNKKYLEFAVDIAKKAGQIMLYYFKGDNGASYKYDQTIVTKADKEINEYLINQVKETFPTHAVDGEEQKYGDSEYKWICDPVDGTAMYARHIPVAVFSLALAKNGVPFVGVIYDPFTDNLYTASKGDGAYLNGKKMTVNDYSIEDMRAVSNFDIWPAAEYNIIDVIRELNSKTYLVSLGSLIRGCACVANGEFIASIFPGTVNKYCDLAAAKIIVEEAGGKVTDMFGNEQRYDRTVNGAIISNGKVHDNILKVINKYCENHKA
jgi:fructose-1,6-bisphosphatase/inositol monophosphatase family enzyme